MKYVYLSSIKAPTFEEVKELAEQKVIVCNDTQHWRASIAAKAESQFYIDKSGQPALRTASTSWRTPNDKINLGKSSIIRYYEDGIELCWKRPSVYSWGPAASVLKGYGFECTYGTVPPLRGEYVVCLPIPSSWKNKLDLDSVTDDNLMEKVSRNWAVPIAVGLKVNYKGVPMAECPLTFREVVKKCTTQLKRQSAGKERDRLVRILGFYTSFDLEGYPLPPDLTVEKAHALNESARMLGYADIRTAWMDNVPILGEVDDEFVAHLGEGLVGLMAQAEKQRREK